MKSSRETTLLFKTVLFFIAFNSAAVFSNDTGKSLSSYPNYGTDSTEKCYSVLHATEIAGKFKEQGSTLNEAKLVLKQGIKDGELPAEAEELFLRMLEMAYSRAHAHKSKEKYMEDVEHMCKTPEVRFCDTEIETAMFVGKAKEDGASQTKLSRMLYQKEGLSSKYFDILDMIFWPEHENKTAQEYSDYVANEWCAKYTEKERKLMFNSRDDEVQGVTK